MNKKVSDLKWICLLPIAPNNLAYTRDLHNGIINEFIQNSWLSILVTPNLKHP